MLVIPAIDLKDGQCVRLRQGNMHDSTVFGDNPVDFARRWVDQGARRLHLVDLNGAFAGEPVNAEIVNEITKALPTLPIQIGGGIRNGDTIELYLKAGVSYVIIGTKAVKDPAFVSDMCRQFSGRIIVGLDAKSGLVATDGWAEVSTIKATELAQQFETDGVEAIIYTDIARDGMMKGVNIEANITMAKASSIPIIASGGVTTIEDIKQLKLQAHHGISGVIAGRALYEGSLQLKQAQSLCDSQ